MKIFTAAQIRAWDAYTIKHEPIASVDLMNRAARVFTAWFTARYPDTERPVYVFAGTGNNGGDGLAVALLLHRAFYTAKVFVCDFTGKQSADFTAQMEALKDIVVIKDIKEIMDNPNFLNDAQNDRNDFNILNNFNNASNYPLIIDALFGSGLSRPLEGEWAQLIGYLNNLPNDIVSIDLPSGLFGDAHAEGPCIRARRTFSFETPKRAFFFPENADRVGEWAFGSIGLHRDFAAQCETPDHYLTLDDVRRLIRPRGKFSHKGSFGHALLIAGSYGKMGAAVLAARACLRAGVGLLTVQAPRCGDAILQASVPEAMLLADPQESFWTQTPDMQQHSAVGVGPGIGTEAATATALERLLRAATTALVLDADALNLLARHPAWWASVPRDSILTPHPKEFGRLFGQSANDFERNALQRRKAQEHRVFIILKGANTAIAAPDGTCWFNSTGNPGMATGGSGDVLTGVLTGLFAQGYPPLNACLLGVFLHGLAGDLAATDKSEAAMVAGDLVEYLGKAWKEIESD